MLKPRQVVAALQRLGFVEVRQRGSHKLRLSLSWGHIWKVNFRDILSQR